MSLRLCLVSFTLISPSFILTFFLYPSQKSNLSQKKKTLCKAEQEEKQILIEFCLTCVGKGTLELQTIFLSLSSAYVYFIIKGAKMIKEKNMIYSVVHLQLVAFLEDSFFLPSTYIKRELFICWIRIALRQAAVACFAMRREWNGMWSEKENECKREDLQFVLGTHRPTFGIIQRLKSSFSSSSCWLFSSSWSKVISSRSTSLWSFNLVERRGVKRRSTAAPHKFMASSIHHSCFSCFSTLANCTAKTLSLLANRF